MREPIGNDGELPSVRVEGRSFQIARRLGEIDLDNLQREVQDVGGHAIWWGVLAAQMQAVHARAKLAVELVEGQTAKSLRLEKTRLNEKITEAIIAEETKMHPDVIAAKQALIEADERLNILKAVAFTIGEKQRALTRLSGALAREISDDDPRTLLPHRREMQ